MSAAGLSEALHALPEYIHVLEDMEEVCFEKKAVGLPWVATWADSQGNNFRQAVAEGIRDSVYEIVLRRK